MERTLAPKEALAFIRESCFEEVENPSGTGQGWGKREAPLELLLWAVVLAPRVRRSLSSQSVLVQPPRQSSFH